MTNERYKDAVFPVLWTVFALFFFLPHLVFDQYPLWKLFLTEASTCWYPYWFFTRSELFAGFFPLWSPHVMLGVPLGYDPVSGFCYPILLLTIFMSAARGFTVMMFAHYAVAGVGAYLFVLETGGSRKGAAAAGIAFPFCGYFLYLSQFFVSLGNLALMPLAFYFLIRAGKSFSIRYFLGLSLIFFIEYSGDITTLAWQLVGMGIVAMWSMRRMIAMALSLATGFMMCSVNIFPIIDLTGQSVRKDGLTFEFFASGQKSLSALFMVLIPYVPGVKAFPSFLYIGWVAIILILVGVAVSKNRLRDAGLVSVLIILMLVVLSTRPIIDIFYHLPFFKMTQLHRNAIVLFFPIFMLLLAWGFDRTGALLKGKYFAAGSVLTVITMGVAKYFIFHKLFDASLMIIAAIFLAFAIYNKRSSLVLFGLLAVLAADMAPLTISSFPRNDSPPTIPWTPLADLAERDDLARYYPLSKSRAYDFMIGGTTSLIFPRNRLHAVSGFQRSLPLHSGKVLQILQPRYIEWKDGKLYRQKSHALMEYPADPSKRALMAMLNIRYAVTSNMELPYKDNIKSIIDGERSILEFTDYFPRAWFVTNATSGSDEEAREWLQNASVDEFANSIFIDDPGYGTISSTEPATAEVTVREYSAQRLEFDVRSSGDGFLILSDGYYPGWRAKVDDTEVKILRANLAFRAIPLSGGHHKVEMEFAPPVFKAALWSSICSVMSFFTLVIYFYRRRQEA